MNEQGGEADRQLRTTLKVAACSMGFNLLLMAGKYGLSVISGSAALRADAVHSLADVIGSGSVMAGLYFSHSRSKHFPYGLYKIENLVSLGLGLGIMFAGYELGREAAVQAAVRTGGEKLTNVPTALAGVIIFIIAMFLFSRWERSMAEKTNSPALEADSGDFYTDALASAAIVASLVASLVGLRIDWLATMVIVVFVVYTGFQITLDAVRVLLDASVDREVLNSIEEVIREQREVAEIKDLRGRNSGSFRFIQAVIVLDLTGLEAAHEVSHRIEGQVREAAQNVDNVIIHYEPLQQQEHRWAVPIEGDEVCRHFGEAPVFLIADVRASDDRIIRQRRVKNPYTDIEHGKGIKVSEMLIDEDVDRVLVRESLRGKGPYYALQQARVRMLEIDETDIADALEAAGVDVEGSEPLPAEGY